MAQQQIIIDSLTCPITCQIMTDPVQGNDGQTYERSAITHALNIKQESPITRQYMTVADLHVSSTIRFLLDKYNDGTLFGPFVVNEGEGEADAEADAEVHDQSSISDSIKISVKTYYQTNVDTDTHTQNNMLFKFDLDVPADLVRIGTDLVMAIDRSGSMGTPVEAKDESGVALENGFSQQDIVNHAAKTVAKSMGPLDRLCIITFDGQIETIFQLTVMTEMNCSRAIRVIETITPRGQTDIWHAIEKGIEVLHMRDDKTRNGAIILLTDGVPNVSPSRGEEYALTEKRAKLGFYCPIYTVGFGYNLQQGLLYNLAKIGDGITGHIPDAGMIATVFSNFLGNILCTVAYNMVLRVEFEDSGAQDLDGGVYKVNIAGDFNVEDIYATRTVAIKMGSIQVGQSRNIIITGSRKPIIYTYSYTIGNKDYSFDANFENISYVENRAIIRPQLARFYVVEQLTKIIEQKNMGYSTIAMYDEMLAYFVGMGVNLSDPLISGLYNTVCDQVGLAVSENPNHKTKGVSYFMRWGRFYLDQLRRALNQEMKPNFKDKACHFGGTLFNTLVDHTSDQFDNLPPPKPSAISSVTRSTNNSGSTNLAPSNVSMSTYNSQSTPCFTGTSKILLANSESKNIKDLEKGDLVKTLSYTDGLFSSAKVVCILKTIIPSRKADLVMFGSGLQITPWHPVFVNDEWQFPINIGVVKEEECDAVYSVLLDSMHVFSVNDIWCVGLGHSYDDGILKHAYYGTTAIIADMMAMKGWSEGLVTK